jgi:hypothetical protein
VEFPFKFCPFRTHRRLPGSWPETAFEEIWWLAAFEQLNTSSNETSGESTRFHLSSLRVSQGLLPVCS